jgi:3-hydroxy-3-methylglutaryl CoA synthase
MHTAAAYTTQSHPFHTPYFATPCSHPRSNSVHTPQVGPSLCLAARIGPMHTAAAYTNLTSLLLEKRESLLGKSIALFSYGSGAASTLYRLQVLTIKQPTPHLDFVPAAGADSKTIGSSEPNSFTLYRLHVSQ